MTVCRRRRWCPERQEADDSLPAPAMVPGTVAAEVSPSDSLAATNVGLAAGAGTVAAEVSRSDSLAAPKAVGCSLHQRCRGAAVSAVFHEWARQRPLSRQPGTVRLLSTTLDQPSHDVPGLSGQALEQVDTPVLLTDEADVTGAADRDRGSYPRFATGGEIAEIVRVTKG
jgi:hypothetical protein